eukprot:TRINITY_DN16400_c0_g2_i3.p1 TRINITY_DN16400_c0_g2~~TRINITY_DN16400_c0_g2_i3.p1  ORF type:complete len:100 (-),score=5.38 TRINITY_DN16400_c0_g2_i3:18-317(-)
MKSIRVSPSGSSVSRAEMAAKVPSCNAADSQYLHADGGSTWVCRSEFFFEKHFFEKNNVLMSDGGVQAKRAPECCGVITAVGVELVESRFKGLPPTLGD